VKLLPTVAQPPFFAFDASRRAGNKKASIVADAGFLIAAGAYQISARAYLGL
jgi:hypothetical protein